MTTISVSDFRGDISDFLNQVAYKGERIVLKRRNKGVAVLISMEDAQLLQALEDEADRKEVARARREIEREGTVSWEEAKAGFGE